MYKYFMVEFAKISSQFDGSFFILFDILEEKLVFCFDVIVIKILLKWDQ
jgi:hypothetical protein